jgi:hypothetical protein
MLFAENSGVSGAGRNPGRAKSAAQAGARFDAAPVDFGADSVLHDGSIFGNRGRLARLFGLEPPFGRQKIAN